MGNHLNTLRLNLTRISLGLLILFTFWPVVHHEFVLYDDLQYVTANPHVLSGLTFANIHWAFTTGYYANWIPLSLISHMCDVEFFGLNPGAHHLTNVFLHVLNGLLLFEFLRRATGSHWRSAMATGLFAIHPLRVESVAWVAERKDVLSTFFFLLTLFTYLRYAQTSSFSQKTGVASSMDENPTMRGKGNHYFPRVMYAAALLCFACGLMSKSMVVTLPCVMLLLDFWPLRRVGGTSVTQLLLEKLPFMTLAILTSAITFYTQKVAGAMEMVQHLSLGARVANALLSYVKYIGKTCWPSNLAVLYPYQQIASWQTIIATGVILLISAGAIWMRFRRPYFLVGWLWFLGTLVPVIGIVQVGEQAMADRYSYIPSIGLFILAVWWASDLAVGLPQGRCILTVAAISILTILTLTTRHQLTYWRTSQALFEHDVLVTGGTGVIYNNLGMIQMEKGNWLEAEKLFKEGLRLQPNYDRASINLALALASEGKPAEAASQLKNMDPGWELEGHRMLAQKFTEQMKISEATTQYVAEVRLAPANADIRNTLGASFFQQGRMSEAAEQYSELVRLRGDAEAHWHLAVALEADGRSDAAIPHYREASRLKPDWADPLNDLAWLLATDPQPAVRNGAEAVGLAERACVLNSYKEARFLGTLDAAYAESGRFAEAIKTAESARELALKEGEQPVVDAATERLKLYHAGRAYHQPDHAK